MNVRVTEVTLWQICLGYYSRVDELFFCTKASTHVFYITTAI